ncbi:uncharacterized protein LOC128964285 [Oppia nitens]|uniref:uncharacterized protein LOC128964285 n=1 Tax=Oppia nitens TaxID=1686743 RepID=UPI0023D9F938|nr:uncharacterized protein LOC128964285 [Oppia nitens]
MYKSILFTLIGIYFVIQTVISAPQEKKCPNETLRETCVHSLFIIGSPDSKFPDSSDQLKAFCGKLKDTDKCVKDYTKRCMSPTGRRATEVAVAGISRLLKRMCKSNERRAEFVKNAGCGNAVIPDMRSCLNSYKLSLYGAQKAPLSDKLPILCCKFHDFRGCVRKGFDRVGSQVCPEESRKYFGHIADAFQSDVFDLICSNYDADSDKCKAVVVPEVTESEETRSLLKPLRNVLKSVLESDNN